LTKIKKMTHLASPSLTLVPIVSTCLYDTDSIIAIQHLFSPFCATQPTDCLIHTYKKSIRKTKAKLLWTCGYF
ncbi:hypothetical protein, partial [Levilactobacillus brevis]|uniref:hypothetical protein n=1 Tax=Levilactobacillus brevis TaxID=1580 RepID=UPI001BDEC2CC